MGNIFIAVIGDAYQQVLGGIEDRWNNDVNELMFMQLWMRLSRARLKQLSGLKFFQLSQLQYTKALTAVEKDAYTKEVAYLTERFSTADEKDTRVKEILYLKKRLAHSKTGSEMEMPGVLRALLDVFGYCCCVETHTFPLPFRTTHPEPKEPVDDDDDSAMDAVWRWRNVTRPAERLFQFDWTRLPEVGPAVLEDALKSAQTRRREQKDALVHGIAAKLEGLEERFDAHYDAFLSYTTESFLSSDEARAQE